MFNRTLGGIAAALTVAGTATAQMPSFGFGSRPAFVPKQRADAPDIQQTAMKADVTALPPVVLPSASVVSRERCKQSKTP